MNCQAQDCTKAKYSNELCSTHYMAAYRIRKSGQIKSGLDPAIAQAVAKRHGAHDCCEKCDCKKIHGRGLCNTHYAQMLRARKKINASL
jgi:hypothetical protein